ncbi:MAG TPA: hypothetical protein VNB29_11720, partial [Chthoniobacterales bacterium]|nr:hypothetical protein [Chthoniobacterales bacterium]
HQLNPACAIRECHFLRKVSFQLFRKKDRIFQMKALSHESFALILRRRQSAETLMNRGVDQLFRKSFQIHRKAAFQDF